MMTDFDQGLKTGIVLAFVAMLGMYSTYVLIEWAMY